MQTHRRAFTLIELSITLLVIAACIAIAFPTFSAGAINQRQLRSTANKIAAIAEYTRHRAITTQSTHLLSINPLQGTYGVTAQNENGTAIPIADGINLDGKLPKNITFDDILFQQPKPRTDEIVKIEFSPQGWIEPVEIYISAPESKQFCIITKELSGKIETVELAE